MACLDYVLATNVEVAQRCVVSSLTLEHGWQDPPSAWLKINWDATFNDKIGRSAMTVVVRISSKEAFSLNKLGKYYLSPLMAEAIL